MSTLSPSAMSLSIVAPSPPPVAWIMRMSPVQRSPPVLSSSSRSLSAGAAGAIADAPRTPEGETSPTRVLSADINKAKAASFNERLAQARRRLVEATGERQRRIHFELEARDMAAASARERALRSTAEKAAAVVTRARHVARRVRFNKALESMERAQDLSLKLARASERRDRFLAERATSGVKLASPRRSSASTGGSSVPPSPCDERPLRVHFVQENTRRPPFPAEGALRPAIPKLRVDLLVTQGDAGTSLPSSPPQKAPAATGRLQSLSIALAGLAPQANVPHAWTEDDALEEKHNAATSPQGATPPAGMDVSVQTSTPDEGLTGMDTMGGSLSTGQAWAAFVPMRPSSVAAAGPLISHVPAPLLKALSRRRPLRSPRASSDALRRAAKARAHYMAARVAFAQLVATRVARAALRRATVRARLATRTARAQLVACVLRDAHISLIKAAAARTSARGTHVRMRRQVQQARKETFFCLRANHRAEAAALRRKAFLDERVRRARVAATTARYATFKNALQSSLHEEAVRERTHGRAARAAANRSANLKDKQARARACSSLLAKVRAREELRSAIAADVNEMVEAAVIAKAIVEAAIGQAVARSVAPCPWQQSADKDQPTTTAIVPVDGAKVGVHEGTTVAVADDECEDEDEEDEGWLIL
mmetsp:Transcript_7208/g.20966  ORF Transcript_7208/g.20966 Transcript_7208/m.20966 type:complete len:657 (-) Transcript_7208:218-2188(-)